MRFSQNIVGTIYSKQLQFTALVNKIAKAAKNPCNLLLQEHYAKSLEFGIPAEEPGSDPEPEPHHF
jgi:hypothetical protein